MTARITYKEGRFDSPNRFGVFLDGRKVGTIVVTGRVSGAYQYYYRPDKAPRGAIGASFDTVEACKRSLEALWPLEA
mgnify:CR=1 FL=1